MMKVIKLALTPVGRIQGRLVSPHGEPIRGVTIRATTQVGGYAGSGQGGVARVACDEQGRFVIPAIAAGMMTLEPGVRPRAGHDVPQLAAEPDPGPGGPDDRGDDPGAARP